MKKQSIKVAVSVGLISLGLASSANAALVGRLAATPGGTDYQAYYDTEADLTWLADANYARTSGYPRTYGDGSMIWQVANDWAAQLTVDGVSGWRLPTTLQPDASCGNQSGSISYGYNCTGSELGDLFYNALGNTAGSLTNTGPFSNVQPLAYWSATELLSNTYDAWIFNMGNGGYQYYRNKNNFTSIGWAVQSGDVSAVPVPAAVWLFGSGLLGLIGVTRRKNAQTL